VLEYDDTVTTVDTAEPVAQRGVDQGAEPPPMVRMPGEDGGVAAPAPPPPSMIPADQAALATGDAEAEAAFAPVTGDADAEAAEAASAPAPTAGEPALAPAAAIASDVAPDVEAKAAGRVEIAPTPAEAARDALPAKPAADAAAVRTTNPWHKAAPWD